MTIEEKNVNTAPQQEVPSAEQEGANEQPLQPSRAKLAFEENKPVKEPSSEAEKKLLQLDSEGDTSSTQQDVSEAKAEQPTEKNNSLPTLEELDLPEDLGVADKKESSESPQSEGEAEGEAPDELQKFAESFEKYMGMPLEDFQNQFKTTQAYVAQVQAEKARLEASKTLAQEWGVDVTEVDARLERVQERFSKYPKEMQDRLDSLEGAKLIWDRIQLEESVRLNKKVPEFQRSKGRSSAKPSVMFTQKEIDDMSPEVYERNADRILRAYQLGLVQ